MGGGAWSPLSLFAAGEQGAWYQPSDLSTLFQDAAGTTPVTAVEQRVGLMLDKSKGLALGSELVTNGDFSNGVTGWAESAVGALSVSSGQATVVNITSGAKYAYQSISTVVGRLYLVTFDVISTAGGATQGRVSAGNSISNEGAGAATFNVGTRQLIIYPQTTTTFVRFGPAGTGINYAATFDNISVKEIAGNHAFQATTTPNDKRPILSARVNLLLATATLSTQSVTTQATSYNLYFTGTGSITLSGTATGTYSAGSNAITCTAGTLTLTVSGSVLTADLRPANIGNNIPAYQRVNTATDYDTAGFPYYLKADGTYTSMSTNSINFSATDKMTVVSGVRKLSDAAQGVVSELSATSASNNGSFTLSAPGGAATNYTWL